MLRRSTSLILAVAVSTIACSKGPSGTSVTSNSEPPDSNCPYGGVHFTSASGSSYACNGAPGGTGPAGSPDTPSQVLSKLLSVDSADAGIDATLLGGLSAASYQARVTGTCAVGMAVTAVAADGTVTCSSPFQRTVVVSPMGTPAQNGAALTAALTGITTASATRPFLLKVEPGIYDVGATGLSLVPYVDVEGSGEATTTIQGTVNGNPPTAGVLTANGLSTPVEVRGLTVSNTSTGVQAPAAYVTNGSLKLAHVTLSSSGATVSYGLQTVFGGAALQHVTIQSSTEGIQVVGGPLTLVDSDVSGGSYGVEMTSDPSHTPAVEIRNSRIAGSTDALLVDVSQGSMKVATSLVAGPVANFGTMICVGDFNAGYAALNTSCQ